MTRRQFIAQAPTPARIKAAMVMNDCSLLIGSPIGMVSAAGNIRSRRAETL